MRGMIRWDRVALAVVFASGIGLGSAQVSSAKEPDHITVQHILIGFTGSVPGKNITRSKPEAQKLAKDILAQAKKKGANFDALVSKYTDDSPPGVYKMSNRGVAPGAADEYPRERMVPAFGDVGFVLKKGDFGLAEHDPAKSPYGYHIIKRVQ